MWGPFPGMSMPLSPLLFPKLFLALAPCKGSALSEGITPCPPMWPHPAPSPCYLAIEAPQTMLPFGCFPFPSYLVTHFLGLRSPHLPPWPDLGNVCNFPLPCKWGNPQEIFFQSSDIESSDKGIEIHILASIYTGIFKKI